MGTISLEHMDNLYWLGRYTERVYATLRLYFRTYDNMIDFTAEDYKSYCEMIDIPDIYGSAEEFKARYPFDKNDMNSIASTLGRAHDNGIIMRELIGSETLAYVQIAAYDLQKAKDSESPMIEMQYVIDHLLSFWGIADDIIDDSKIRNIMKTGKRVERIDLYARLGFTPAEILTEVNRLKPRLEQSGLSYRPENLSEIEEILKGEAPDYYRVVSLIESILI